MYLPHYLLHINYEEGEHISKAIMIVVQTAGMLMVAKMAYSYWLKQPNRA